MEAAAFDPAHVDIALVHEWFDEEGERLAACPEGWVGADVRPQRLHQFEAAADVGNNLWQDGGSATGEHAQCHIWARSHHIHKLLEREVRGDRLVALLGVFEQREGIAQR